MEVPPLCSSLYTVTSTVSMYCTLLPHQPCVKFLVKFIKCYSIVTQYRYCVPENCSALLIMFRSALLLELLFAQLQQKISNINGTDGGT